LKSDIGEMMKAAAKLAILMTASWLELAVNIGSVLMILDISR
jgi:hypothetical protein